MQLRFFSSAILFFILFLTASSEAQKTATFREVQRIMPTYGFSDPDTVADIGRIYPYHRFDGYATEAQEQTWTFIELENDYIKVFITPEIGGKIWGAVEKSTGKEFIYFNDVVKFRHVALRGPWTSGGIETNFGVIGHAPTCSTPVDYLVGKNEDDSVSCVIGALDLPSRTEWRVEINLRPDTAYFTTRALWYNPTALEQSYYHWMNAAVKADGNLEFAYPGTNYVGHDGSLHGWPIHPDGRDLSWYENNNFGGSKSYHVLGEATGFFGGYWHEDEFGFGRFSRYEDKPGKKLWIWALSRQGRIWEDLLTDSDGQYVEIQSGRLFNQEASGSIHTPFKHRSFAPGSSDEWTEYWFPVMATEGITQASARASVNLKVVEGDLQVWISANEAIEDTLVLENKDGFSVQFDLDMAPATVWRTTTPYTGEIDTLAVRIGSDSIIPRGGRAGQVLSRPMELVDFDWTSVQGVAIEAKSLEQERSFNEALSKYQQCLEKDPFYIPALVGAAGLYVRRAELEIALTLVGKALSVDTYAPSANFLYATIHEALGNAADALDGYAITVASPEYRSPAYLGLARVYYKRGQRIEAIDCAQRSIANNALNIPAREFLLFLYRQSGYEERFQGQLRETLDLDPLNHFARFENYRMNPSSSQLNHFLKVIQNELPHETFLELALKYFKLGSFEEATLVLELAPVHPVILYWQAYLAERKGANRGDWMKLLGEANEQAAKLVFPHRRETIPVLEWAGAQSDSWKPDYYLGLLSWNLGLVEKARNQFRGLGNQPDFAPFYQAKAELFSENSGMIEQSLKKAIQMAPSDWRARLALSRFYLDQGEVAAALEPVEKAFEEAPQNYYLGLHLSKVLLLSEAYAESLELLNHLEVLPNEGATEGRHLYRLSNLNLAWDALQRGSMNKAAPYIDASRQWPENLGVGKPYFTDERIEDYLEGLAQDDTQLNEWDKESLEKVLSFEGDSQVTGGDVIVLAAYLELGDRAKALKQLNTWREQHPESTILAWAEQWLNGDTQALQQSLSAWHHVHPNPNLGSDEYYAAWLFERVLNPLP